MGQKIGKASFEDDAKAEPSQRGNSRWGRKYGSMGAKGSRDSVTDSSQKKKDVHVLEDRLNAFLGYY